VRYTFVARFIIKVYTKMFAEHTPSFHLSLPPMILKPGTHPRATADRATPNTIKGFRDLTAAFTTVFLKIRHFIARKSENTSVSYTELLQAKLPLFV